jgi:hypothetical protein
VDVIDGEDDYYWVLDTHKGIVHSSCVGGWIPLKGKLDPKDYRELVRVWNLNNTESSRIIMTPIDRLAQYVRERHGSNQSFENLVENLRKEEKRNIKQAVLYALDEDGHSGDWKLAFAEKYYIENHQNK